MEDALLPYQPSLANATNTRVETSARHHQQCRVSKDDMLLLMDTKNDQIELQKNKYRYCIHKDEFAVGIGRPWVSDATRKKASKGYPRVISNLGQMDGKTPRSLTFQKVLTFVYHHARDVRERNCLINLFNTLAVNNANLVDAAPIWFTAEERLHIPEVTRCIYDPVSVGYATTLGWAHEANGDTMVTVMIGGLRTVQNGDFEIFTGDLVQWYWPFERNCFERDGRRKHAVMLDEDDYTANDILNTSCFVGASAAETRLRLDPTTEERRVFHERQYGQRAGTQKIVAQLKPYVSTPDEHLYDRMRVFGIAISCARPHEMVDIKISRQAM